MALNLEGRFPSSLNLEGRFPSRIKYQTSFFGEEAEGRHSDDLDCWCDVNTESKHPCYYGDCKVEKVYDDIADFLPQDPFGTLNPGSTCDCKADFFSDNTIDLLPSDPFDMGISATITTFTRWIEDFESVEAGLDDVDDHVVAELNIFWEGGEMFRSNMLNTETNLGFEGGLHEGLPLVDGNSEDFWSFINDKYSVDVDACGKYNGCVEFNIDLLPSDPFDMAFTGWIEDFKSVEAGLDDVDDHVIAELNIFWKGGEMFHSNMLKTETNLGFEGGLHEGLPLVDGNSEDVWSFIYDKYSDDVDACGKYNGCVESNIGVKLGPPPDALFFVLGYLGVRDLLSVERVCKSLRNAVQTDPLLWRSIHIDYQLNSEITDDVLLHLAERAQGSLDSLSLMECLNITDRGLKRVLETNKRLTQLNVAGCLRLSIECIIDNLKLFKSIARPGIKNLRIGGIFGVTSQNFEELRLLLSDENLNLHGSLKPRFYRTGQLYLSFDDDRYIDIESCPGCQHVRQVYDCPADSCRGKWNTPQACRACIFCIPRCINCGRCLSNCDYEETFCMDAMCLDCWEEIFICQEYSSFCQSTVVVVRRQVSTVPSVDVDIR